MPHQAEDLRVLAFLLRQLPNYTREQMAAATGLHRATICRYEEGHYTPSRRSLEKIAKAASVPMSAVDGLLLPAIAAGRWFSANGATVLPGDADRLLPTGLQEAQAVAAAAAVAEFMAEQDLADGEDADVSAPTARPNGLAIQDPWPVDQPRATEGLEPQLKLYLQFERLSLHLCEASAQAAANDAAEALALARRALRVAELASGDPAWRLRLEGFIWAFIANALRVGGDLPAADASFVTAWKLWRTGAAADGSTLAEWRLQDLQASLLRDHRHFAAALGLLERSLGAAPPEAKGRILLKKSATLEQAGEAEAALAVLREAAPLVDRTRDLRLRFGVRFNLAVLLCHLGRHAEGQRQLATLERLAAQLGNQLDLLRVRWLTGRVAASLGRRDEARAVLAAVQRQLAETSSAYDAALVSLELAIIELHDHRTAEVRRLAEEMLWIFSSQAVHREALAALSLFRQAVESESVTVELACSVLAYLERARHDEQLVFESST